MIINIPKKFNFTEDQIELVNKATTSNTAENNGAVAITYIYLINTLEKVSKKIVDSNEKVSKSNEKHSKMMVFLTGSLVFVGLVQAGIAIFSYSYF